MIMKTVAGPSAYTTGGFTTTVGDFEKVDKVAVSVFGTTFYHPQVASISGNTVTIKVFRWDSASTAVAEVAADTDLSGVTFVLIVSGY